MKKSLLHYLIACVVILSISSFIFLNYENADFPISSITFENAQEAASTIEVLPDIEWMKSSLEIIREVLFFDL